MSGGGLVLQFGPLSPPSVLAGWAESRRTPLDVRRLDQGEIDSLDVEPDWVAILGARFTPLDAEAAEVGTSRRIVEQALATDTPVLGLCYGAQLLASVLGGTIERMEQPELGWASMESRDPAVIPEGPWLSWHWYRFTLPPGSEELARNRQGVQAFRQGRHLGVQFHPESTAELVRGWAEKDRARPGVDEGRKVLDDGERENASAAAEQAYTLFDGFARSASGGRDPAASERKEEGSHGSR